MRIAISGFNRTGRNVFKMASEHPGIEIVAVNDSVSAQSLARLLRYDSVYGIYNKEVSIQNGALLVDQDEILLTSEDDCSRLPWKDLGIDLVIDNTEPDPESGRRVYDEHLAAGASKVLLTSPVRADGIQTLIAREGMKDPDPDVSVFSAGGPEACAVTPLLHVLHSRFGILRGTFTITRSVTEDQSVLDRSGPDFLRSRSAFHNIIPQRSVTAEIAESVIPELKGRLSSLSVRVPVPAGALIDLVVQAGEEVSRDRLNEAVAEASRELSNGIISYSDDPLVSSDVRGSSFSAVYDAPSAIVSDGGFIKLLSWFDSEFGYSARIADLAQILAKKE